MRHEVVERMKESHLRRTIMEVPGWGELAQRSSEGPSQVGLVMTSEEK
jgi:hypothetical protein